MPSDKEKHDTKILAVAGKGGVGKTSIAASIVRLLAENHPDSRILAIDADPAVGLSTALGIEVEITIDDIRKAVVAAAEKGDTRDAVEPAGRGPLPHLRCPWWRLTASASSLWDVPRRQAATVR